MSLVRRIARRAGWRERVLIVGTGSATYGIAEEIQNTPKDHSLIGVFDSLQWVMDAPAPEAAPSDNLSVGTVGQLTDAVSRLRPDRIIVALSDPRACVSVRDLVRSCSNEIAVETVVEAQARLTGKLAIETLTPGSLVLAGSLRYRMLKRALSLVVATVGLLLGAPLMILIAVLIKLDSRGPIFFVQERIGLRGRRFRLIKFRSMLPEAGSASEWERDHADRITRVGQWLRKYHLDELPQFLNILRGDMELVGPRPHPLSNHELFHREIPHYGLRAETSPGLTGWAQVRNGYANNLDDEMEKMRYDLYYLTHQSLALDLWIVLETVKIVIFGRQPEGRRVAKQPPRIRQSSSVWRRSVRPS